MFKRHSSKRATPRRPGRGTLVILALFLVGSAALRIAEGDAIAFASATEALPPAAPAEQVSPNLDKILAALSEREARIEAREISLDTKEQALKLVEQRIDEQLLVLEDAEQELRSTIALAQTASEDDLAQLTSVYENMGAEEAAALFAQMEPNFAAGFLARMRPDIAAALMAGLDPNAAYEISVILAGRNAEVPSE